MNLDQKIILSVFELGFFDNPFFIFLAKWFLVIVIFVLFFYLFFHKTLESFYVLRVLLMSWLFSVFLKLIIGRPRPFVEIESINPVLLPADNSFPSGHTFALAFLGFFLWRDDKKLGIFLVISSLVVGLSRVVIGIHYLFDILGGFILGLLSAIIYKKVLKNKKKIT